MVVFESLDLLGLGSVIVLEVVDVLELETAHVVGRF